MSSTSASSPERDTAINGTHAESQADFKLWSDFLGRSESMNKRTRTTSSSSAIPDRIRGELDDEATVDTILADYRSKEAQRRKSTTSEIERNNAASEGRKTAHGAPPTALLDRVGGFFGNLMDGRGWRRN